MLIDLRSDTLTKPSAEMIGAMLKATIGDACYEEDLSTKNLEKYCASLLGKEATIFMPSGTMSNQVAIRSMTNVGDEIILDDSYHINFFESAQTVDLSKAVLNCCKTKDGILDLEIIQSAIDRKARWTNAYAVPKIISLENTISTQGGKIFPFDKIKDIYKFAKKNKIFVYIDGARIFNACVATGINIKDYSKYCDMISFCFSKGLGTPFGSILCGNNDLISRARKFRKWYGGAMHQSGFMAEAALYSLKNNIKRLKDDHNNAKIFAEIIKNNKKFEVATPETNIVIIMTKKSKIESQEIVEIAKKNNVLLLAWTKYTTRAVFSLNNSREDTVKAAKIIATI